MARQTVLIVDDEPHMGNALSRVLRSAGYQPMTVTSGKAALAYVDSNTPDIILMDFNMPGMDGTEVTARMRQLQNTATVPIVMVTARFEPEEVDLAFQRGADDYLMKPFEKEDLKRKVREVLQLAAEGRLPSQMKAEIATDEAKAEVQAVTEEPPEILGAPAAQSATASTPATSPPPAPPAPPATKASLSKEADDKAMAAKRAAADAAVARAKAAEAAAEVAAAEAAAAEAAAKAAPPDQAEESDGSNEE